VKGARPLVSVVIPVYNCEAYLAEAVRSVLAQPYRPLEIIIVNDGSTDRGAEVAQGFADPLVRYFYQENAGIGAARNTGVSLARGGYLAFLDADDTWTPEKLTLQMACFEEDPELDMVFGQVIEFHESPSGGPSPARAELEGGGLAGYFAGTLLIKRESFLRVGPFETRWRVGEFVDWYAKAAELGLKSHLLPAVVMRRRIHETNVGIRRRSSQVDYVRILKQALDRRRGGEPL
jgi:glycosyltransferase involved in cell wall biosynthesis